MVASTGDNTQESTGSGPGRGGQHWGREIASWLLETKKHPKKQVWGNKQTNKIQVWGYRRTQGKGKNGVNLMQST